MEYLRDRHFDIIAGLPQDGRSLIRIKVRVIEESADIDRSLIILVRRNHIFIPRQSPRIRAF